MPCSTSARYTGTRSGKPASMRALATIASTATTATVRLLRAASTAAPAGTWASMNVTVPMLSASPIWPCVHAWDAR